MDGSRSCSAVLSRVMKVCALLLASLALVGPAGFAGSPGEMAATGILADDQQPAITSIYPSAGPADGGTKVTIFGSGFQDPMQVWFGGLEALDVNVFDDTTPEDKDRITCVTPDYGQQGGAPPFSVDVTVTNVSSGKSDTVEGGFIFRDAPIITGTSPSQGRPGDFIIIEGSGFEDPLWVLFPSDDGEHMEVVSVSSNELVVRIPSDLLPPCEDMLEQFRVIMRETGEIVIGGDFTLLGSTPEIYSVTPAVLQETISEGGPLSPDDLTINGGNFVDAVGVRIGSRYLSRDNISVVDESTVKVENLPDTSGLGIHFDTASCTTGWGTLGRRKLPKSLDVVVTNSRRNCGNILRSGLTVDPFGDICSENPVGDSVVPAAVSAAGMRRSRWESDFRFFNPCMEEMEVRIEFQPTGTNNSGVELDYREFTLNDHETRIFSDIYEAIPGLEGDDVSGSLRVQSSSPSECRVHIVSRTFNRSPYGTMGLSVPALLERTVGGERLDFTGLIHTGEYRSNLRLVNFSDADKFVTLYALDLDGNQLAPGKAVKVKGRSTRQLNDVALRLGVTGELPLFSVRVVTSGAPIDGIATVIDNLTGDSVAYVSSFINENTAWVTGVAHLFGVGDSKWRTDLWLYNPTEVALLGELVYRVDPNFNDPVGFEWPALGGGAAAQWLDIAGHLVEGEDTSGYVVITGKDGGPAPQISARTYSEDDDGGTWGLSLPAYGSRTLLKTGMTGFLVGISDSGDPDVGVRTNFYILNTDQEKDAMVIISRSMSDGSPPPIGNPWSLSLDPGRLYQAPASWLFGLNEETSPVSIRVEVAWGSGVAVYATEIDNLTHDSIFISAQPAVLPDGM